MIALPSTVTLTGDEAREIVDFVYGMKDYLMTAWCGLEELASEANAGVRILKELRGETVAVEEVYDEIEDERRKAAKAIRFALSNVEFIHEALNARANGFGKFTVKEPTGGEAP